MAKKRGKKGTKAQPTIPSVLAFEKKLVPSDGQMFAVDWNSRTAQPGQPLKLQEKSVRGTISNRLPTATSNIASSTDNRIYDSQVQTLFANEVNATSNTTSHATFNRCAQALIA